MSSLKDLASLIMIPSLYKDGRLDTVKPLGNSIIHPDATGNNDGTDGSTPAEGNFTFSRGSNLAATRVDVNGLIEKGRENLLLQSNQFDTTWVNSNTTDTGGQAGYDGSNDAWLLTKNAVASAYIAQTKSTSGVSTASVYVKAGTIDVITLWCNQVGGGNPFGTFNLSTLTLVDSGTIVDSNITSVGNDWYRVSITFSVSTTLFRIYVDNFSNTTAGSIYIQDAQLEVGLVATDYIETGASTAQAGILEDMPRLDYSGSCPALLLEPQRTNSVTQSEYFGSSYWTKAGDVTLTSNYGTSPEGLTNADRIVANASSGGHIVYRNISTTGTHTISIFAKASGYNHLFLGYDGGSLNFGIVFNLSNGTISQNPASLTGSIEAVGSNGWYRCNLTFNYATTNYYFVAAPHDNSGNYNWTGNGTDGILIYGAQIELNSSYPTSYIPTYGSSVTRSHDVSTADTTSILSSNTGTLFVHLKEGGNSNQYGSGSISFGLSDVNFDNSVCWVANSSNTNTLRGVLRVADTQYYLGSNFSASSENKLLIKWGNGSVAFYRNGSLYYSSDNVNDMSGQPLIEFRLPNTARAGLFPVKQAVVFDTALTDSECIALTTL